MDRWAVLTWFDQLDMKASGEEGCRRGFTVTQRGDGRPGQDKPREEGTQAGLDKEVESDMLSCWRCIQVMEEQQARKSRRGQKTEILALLT